MISPIKAKTTRCRKKTARAKTNRTKSRNRTKRKKRTKRKARVKGGVPLSRPHEFMAEFISNLNKNYYVKFKYYQMQNHTQGNVEIIMPSENICKYTLHETKRATRGQEGLTVGDWNMWTDLETGKLPIISDTKNYIDLLVRMKHTAKITGTESFIYWEIPDIPVVKDTDNRLLPITIEKIKNKSWKGTLKGRGVQCWFKEGWAGLGNDDGNAKRIMHYQIKQRKTYFNALFSMVCRFKNAGVKTQNLTESSDDWLNGEQYEKSTDICAGKHECAGSYGKTWIYVTNDARKPTLALKELTLLYGSDADITTLNEVCDESIMAHKIKKGILVAGHNGSNNIAGVKRVLFTVPPPKFVERMMRNCLTQDDKLFFPSILMEYAGVQLGDYLDNYTVSNTPSQNKTPTAGSAQEKYKIYHDHRFNFMKQIAIGLQFMNVNGFIHQDIKAENICVTPHKVEETLEYTIKIIDFGGVDSESSQTSRGQYQGSNITAYGMSVYKERRLDLSDIWAYVILSTSILIPMNDHSGERPLSKTEILNTNHVGFIYSVIEQEENEAFTGVKDKQNKDKQNTREQHRLCNELYTGIDQFFAEKRDDVLLSATLSSLHGAFAPILKIGDLCRLPDEAAVPENIWNTIIAGADDEEDDLAAAPGGPHERAAAARERARARRL